MEDLNFQKSLAFLPPPQNLKNMTAQRSPMTTTEVFVSSFILLRLMEEIMHQFIL